MFKEGCLTLREAAHIFAKVKMIVRLFLFSLLYPCTSLRRRASAHQ